MNLPSKPTRAQMADAIRDNIPLAAGAGVLQSGSTFSARAPIGSKLPEGTVWVKNTSSETIDRFGILGIDSILIKPADNLDFFKQTFALKGVKPKADKHTGKFVICNVPLAPNASGPAFIFGICPVQTDVLATVGDRLDVLDDNPNFLTKTASGRVEVIYAGDAAGGASADHWALVQFGAGTGFVMVKVTGSATGGGIYTGHLMSSPTTKLDPAATLSEGMLGIEGSDSIYIANPSEVGKSTHDLASSGFLPLVYGAISLGQSTDDKPAYMLVGPDQWEDCTS